MTYRQKSLLISFISSLSFLLFGFALLHYNAAEYGWVIFCLLPFCAGLMTGFVSLHRLGWLGLGLACLVFFGLLLIGQLEGFLCVIMSLPLIIPLVLIGRWISIYIARSLKDSSQRIKLSSASVLLFLAGWFWESVEPNQPVIIEEVSTSITLPYPNLDVYNAIKSVDTLDAELPFLMKVDLPIPQKCILQQEKVGGLRTCYFEGGKITERITELEPGRIMRMDVIDYELTGRSWLGFKEAIYNFDSMGPASCKITRTTTYTSKLYPRFYWQPLEKLGIQQEHAFVLANLKKDLTLNR